MVISRRKLNLQEKRLKEIGVPVICKAIPTLLHRKLEPIHQKDRETYGIFYEANKKSKPWSVWYFVLWHIPFFKEHIWEVRKVVWINPIDKTEYFIEPKRKPVEENSPEEQIPSWSTNSPKGLYH